MTNTTHTGPVRGAGRPEATQALERAIDMFAADLSMDPAEVRRKNFIPKDAFPFQTASGPITTSATTSVRSTSRLSRPDTRNCARSKPPDATTAPTSSSASG